MNINYDKIFAPYSPTDTHVTIPKKFFIELFDKMQCNISHQFIHTGTLCDDGILYEDECITGWLKNSKKSPITGETITKKIACHTFKGIQNLVFEYFNYEFLDVYLSEKYMTYEYNSVIIDILLENPENDDITKLTKYSKFDINSLTKKGLTYNIFMLPLNLFNHILNNISKKLCSTDNIGWLNAIRSYDKTKEDYLAKCNKLISLKYITTRDLYDFKNNLKEITTIFENMTNDNINTYEPIIMKYFNYDNYFLLIQLIKKIDLLDILTPNVITYLDSNTVLVNDNTDQNKLDYNEYYVVAKRLREKVATIPNDIHIKKYQTVSNNDDSVIVEYNRILKLFETFYVPAFINSNFKEVNSDQINEEMDYMLYLINNNKVSFYIKCFDEVCCHSLRTHKISKQIMFKLIDLIDQSDLTIIDKNKIHRKVLTNYSNYCNINKYSLDIPHDIISDYFEKFSFMRIYELTKNGELFKNLNNHLGYLLLFNLNSKVKQSDSANLDYNFFLIEEMVKKYCECIHLRTAICNTNFYNGLGMSNEENIKGALCVEVNIILEINAACEYKFSPAIWSLLITYSYTVRTFDLRLVLIVENLIKSKYSRMSEITSSLPYCKKTINNVCIQNNIITRFLECLIAQNKLVKDNESKMYLKKIYKEIHDCCLSEYMQRFKTQIDSNKMIIKKMPCKGLFACPCDNNLLRSLKTINAFV